MDGDEKTACWLWTGSFAPARARFKHYAVPENRERFTEKVGTQTNDRGTPNCHCPALGYAAPAHRVIFAETCEIDIRDVPKLKRCTSDRCVSPWHVRPVGAVTNRREQAPAPVEGQRTREAVLNQLKRVRPYAGFSIASAAQEAELPEDAVTQEIWEEYVAWDAAEAD